MKRTEKMKAKAVMAELSKAELRAMKYMAGYKVSKAVKHDTIDQLEAHKLGRWDVNWLDRSEDRGRIFVLTALGKSVIKELKAAATR